MKLLRYLLATLLTLTTPVPAGWLPLADSIVIPVSNACSTSSGTTITFTAQGTGGANPNRISGVSINWDDSTNAGTASITAVTIGGISMIKAVSALSGAQNSKSEIWYVSNPSGTTANIVITAATAINGITIEVYSLIGFVTDPVVSAVGTTTVSQPYNNKQLALAAGSRQVNVSTSLSNMTNDFSSACGPNLWGVHASQSLRGNNQTLTSIINPTSNTPLIALAVWTPGSAVAGSCTASSNFFARAGTLDATHHSAYDTLICGLVTDGIFSKLDVLYIFATQNTATAQLNLVSSSFSATLNGAPTFTTDRGYTGVAASTTVYIDTGFNPSSGTPNFIQNSAHVSVWCVTNAAADVVSAIGASNPSGQGTSLIPRHTNGSTFYRVTAQGISGVANAVSNGHYLASRTGLTTMVGYKNGASVLTDATGAFSIQSGNFYTIGHNELVTGPQSNQNHFAEARIGP